MVRCTRRKSNLNLGAQDAHVAQAFVAGNQNPLSSPAKNQQPFFEARIVIDQVGQVGIMLTVSKNQHPIRPGSRNQRLLKSYQRNVERAAGTRIAAYQLTDYLEQLGVEVIFGLCGHTVIGFLDALSKSRIRFVSTRHEQIAAHAADGYARASGKPGSIRPAEASPMIAFINTNNKTGVSNATPQPGNNIETLYYVPPTSSASRVPILQLDDTTGQAIFPDLWEIRSQL